jgi:hypothetical protein
VVLTDFGLASATGDSSMTTTGVVLGSPSYLAPERVLDQPAGPAADLWSLGATLYAAVEGRPPYSKSSPVAVLAALAGDELPRPPVHAGALRPVLDALLEKDPARRADAETAERMLRAVADGGTVRTRRRPWLVAATLVAVAVAAAAGFLVRQKDSPAARALPPPVPSAAPATTVSRSPAPARPSPVATTTAPSVTGKPTTAPPTKATVKPTNVAGIDPATWFRLVNRASEKCVDVRGGVAAEHTPVQQLTCGTATGQQFRLLPTGDGNLRIASRLDSFKSLDVTDQAPNDGATIQLWPYNGRQQWRPVPEGGGYFHFVSKFSDKCLDVPSAATGEQVQLDQFSCNGTPAQSFRLEKV